jgi:glycosyltransferase involved in cell wall biosynthesis
MVSERKDRRNQVSDATALRLLHDARQTLTSFGQEARRFSRYLTYGGFADAVHESALVIAHTECGKSEIVSRLAVPPDMIRVVPYFVRMPQKIGPFRRDRPHIVMVSSDAPNKNAALALAAFRMSALATTHDFIIIGPYSERFLRTHGVEKLESGREPQSLPVQSAGRVWSAGPCDHALKWSLIASAEALVSPSLSEGFGMPPAEALYAGVPVAISDIEVYREIYGGHARFFAPDSPRHCSEALTQAATTGLSPEDVSWARWHFSPERRLGQFGNALLGAAGIGDSSVSMAAACRRS